MPAPRNGALFVSSKNDDIFRFGATAVWRKGAIMIHTLFKISPVDLRCVKVALIERLPVMIKQQRPPVYKVASVFIFAL
jgi:hypothetical protein